MVLMELKAQGPSSAIKHKDKVREEDDSGRQGPLLCARCHHKITDRETRTEIGGKHTHYGTNPHGYRFRYGCFRAAPGVVVNGEASTFYSWFPGYSWQACQCAQCQHHIGWRFAKEGDFFFGLILDRLRDPPSS